MAQVARTEAAEAHIGADGTGTPRPRQGWRRATVGTVTGLLCLGWFVVSPTAAMAIPDPTPQPPPGMEAFWQQFGGWFKWGGIVAGVIGFMICGGMMILGRRNRSTTAVDGATGLPWVIGGLSLIALATGLTGAILGG